MAERACAHYNESLFLVGHIRQRVIPWLYLNGMRVTRKNKNDFIVGSVQGEDFNESIGFKLVPDSHVLEISVTIARSDDELSSSRERRTFIINRSLGVYLTIKNEYFCSGPVNPAGPNQSVKIADDREIADLESKLKRIFDKQPVKV